MTPRASSVSRETSRHRQPWFHVKRHVMCGHATTPTWAALLCLTLAVTSCDEPEAASTTSEPTPAAEVRVSREALIAAADRRIDEPLRDALSSSDPGIRREALLGLARNRSRDLPLLGRFLRDTDPTVREAASLAVASSGGEAATALLAGALAAERDPTHRAILIRDLGRTHHPNALPAIRAASDAESPLEREAACLASAEWGLAGEPSPAGLRPRLAVLLDPDQPEPVRRACAYALGRLTPGPREEGVAASLGLALADPSADVRAFAYRAAASEPGITLEVLQPGVLDEDWRVAVQALRALGQRAPGVDDGPTAIARALRATVSAVIVDGALEAGGPTHRLLTAFAAAGGVARSGPVHDLAAELHRELEQLEGGHPRDRALAHCAAAELVDRGRGWPSRVERCGGDVIDDTARRVRAAHVLRDLDGAHAQRVVFLRRLFETGEPRVQQAAVEAAAAIPLSEATSLVLEAFHVNDAGVRASAASTLARIARRPIDPEVVPPPLPMEEVRAALRAMAEQTPEDELETWVSWIDALEATDARALADRLLPLATHPSHGVRQPARELLTQWDQDLPGDWRPVPDGAAPDSVPDAAARPRLRFETSRGPFVVELRPDAAPVTVRRISSLAADGFYDGLSFHRVVPAFVVQGGDPRGDGYGGPGWWQRCEDNRLSYTRGTVGMALAGRDTGGSQFFVTHTPQPHLEGRYTAFGQVVEGIDVIDQLQEGDVIASVSQ